MKLFRSALCLALGLALTLGLAPAALANADPEDAPTGDTLAGAFTTPERIRQVPLTEALQAEGYAPGADGAELYALPSFSDQVTLDLYVYSGSGYQYQAGVALSWRDALAGILNAECGGFYTDALNYEREGVLASWTAQAVAIHSYLLYNGSSAVAYYRAADSSTDQGSLLYQAADAALHKLAVVGEGADPEDYDLALTPYFASAGWDPDTGARGTAACKDVWVQDLPHLVGAESPYDERYCALLGLRWAHDKANYTRWDELVSGIQGLYGIDLSSAWANGDTGCLQVTGRSAYGYVTHTGLTVAGQQVDGQKLYTDFRGTNWTTGLASGSYSIRYVADNLVDEGGSLGVVEEPWHLVAYGSGHGVGLSQVGSLGYALEQGWSAWQILAHYYPGIKLYDYSQEQLYTLSEDSSSLTPLSQAAPAPTPAPTQAPLPRALGDVWDDGDGAIDLLDLLALAGHLNGSALLDETQQRLADLDQDGRVTQADLDSLAEQLCQG